LREGFGLVANWCLWVMATWLSFGREGVGACHCKGAGVFGEEEGSCATTLQALQGPLQIMAAGKPYRGTKPLGNLMGVLSHS
jgi:hypothetical protein